MFLLWKIFLKKQIMHISNELSQQLSIRFQIQIIFVQHHTYVQVVYITLMKIIKFYTECQIDFWKIELFKINLKINTIRKTFGYVVFWFCSNL
jgi:hypothetical protein